MRKGFDGLFGIITHSELQCILSGVDLLGAETKTLRPAIDKRRLAMSGMQDVGQLQSSVTANSKSEEPCLQGCVPMGLLGSDDRAPPDKSQVRLWRIAWHHHTGPAGLQTAAFI
jgi:hypothetical protein